ncbi:hypothetical protein [Cytophaga aurantiaca]|uniref:hypothetical protein n=1 Tax=Cytophaga aurantiaca TaxID=29530 RepID=UPI00037E454C|nr:hypothetical protein [Cytophaga aurantiaca]
MTHINYIRAEAQDDVDSFMSLNTVQNEFLSQKGLTHIEELNLNNFIGVVITHTFDDTQLPMDFDCMFLDDFESVPVITKATLRGCLNYRTKFHTMLWKGHSHFAIFEFDHEVPKIVHSLKHHEQRKRWDPNLIICSRSDADTCRDYLKTEKQDFERFMKEKNPHIYEANKREEEEFKRNLK